MAHRDAPDPDGRAGLDLAHLARKAQKERHARLLRLAPVPERAELLGHERGDPLGQPFRRILLLGQHRHRRTRGGKEREAG